VLVYPVPGSTPKAGAVYTLCTALREFFLHPNCCTPHRVGYVFQRREMHRIHHDDMLRFRDVLPGNGAP